MDKYDFMFSSTLELLTIVAYITYYLLLLYILFIIDYYI